MPLCIHTHPLYKSGVFPLMGPLALPVNSKYVCFFLSKLESVMGWMTQSNNEGMDGKQVGGTIRHAPDLQAVANWPVETTGGKKSIIYL